MERTRALARAAAMLLLGAGGAVHAAEPGSDVAGRSCAWVTSFGGDDVCGIAVPSGQPLGCVTTGAKPHGVAVSADGSRLYVSNEGADTLTVVDTRAKRSIAEVRVGRQPNQIALNPPGDQVWVLNNGDSTISVVGTAQASVMRTIPAGRAPHIIAMNPAKGVAVVTSEGDGTLDLFDLETLERISRIPVFGFPRVLAVDPAGGTAFLTIRWLNGALVVDLGGRGPRERVALGEPRFAPEGKDAHGIALTPDGRTLLLTTQMTGDLTFVDPDSLAVRGRVVAGRNPNWVGVTADSRHAVVSNTDDDSASVIDVAAMKVVATSPVGRQPKRLVVGACPR